MPGEINVGVSMRVELIQRFRLMPGSAFLGSLGSSYQRPLRNSVYGSLDGFTRRQTAQLTQTLGKL